MSELRALVSQLSGGLDLSRYGSSGRRIGQRADAPRRSIERIEAEVTVTEDEDHELTITEHPVERGSAIADHAFRRPSEVRVRVGWSAQYVGGDVRTIYEQILSLQATRQPFDVYTGKMHYQDMLVAGIRTQTNSGLEYTFLADITLRQIILVSTQTLPISSNPNLLADVESNMPTATVGTVKVTQASLTPAQVTSATGRSDFGMPLGPG